LFRHIACALCLEDWSFAMENARIRQSIVLIIDENIASGARCEALTDALGATAICVTSREAADQALTICKPDVVIVADRLPDANGIDIVNHFRQRRALRRTPVILLTQDMPTNELERAVMAGVFASLDKPFTANAFFKLLTAAIHSDGRHTRRRAVDETRKL
jgi:CheY-like chemotaxis protein